MWEKTILSWLQGRLRVEVGEGVGVGEGAVALIVSERLFEIGYMILSVRKWWSYAVALLSRHKKRYKLILWEQKNVLISKVSSRCIYKHLKMQW